MKISTAAAITLIALIFLFFLFYGGGSCKDNFTRTPLSSCTNCRFVRSHVDYAYDDHSNPHWMANPKDTRQPLEDGPIDFYADERKLDNGALFKQYENNWVDGTRKPYIVNDNKTRTLLREVGDEGARRVLDSTPSAMHTRSPAGTAPLYTDLMLAPGDPYPADHPEYGGTGYFVNDQLGS